MLKSESESGSLEVWPEPPRRPERLRLDATDHWDQSRMSWDGWTSMAAPWDGDDSLDNGSLGEEGRLGMGDDWPSIRRADCLGDGLRERWASLVRAGAGDMEADRLSRTAGGAVDGMAPLRLRSAGGEARGRLVAAGDAVGCLLPLGTAPVAARGAGGGTILGESPEGPGCGDAGRWSRRASSGTGAGCGCAAAGRRSRRSTGGTGAAGPRAAATAPRTVAGMAGKWASWGSWRMMRAQVDPCWAMERAAWRQSWPRWPRPPQRKHRFWAMSV